MALVVVLGLVPGLARAQEPRDEGESAATPLERAKEESARDTGPRTRFRLPDGELRTTGERLAAAGQTVRFTVDLERPVGAARLAVRLPDLWVARSRSGLPFARVPGSRDLSGPRARLRRDGRTLAIHFSRARASDKPVIEIQDVGIPAGTYKLPYTWRDRSGRALASGELSVVFYAPVREGGSRGPFSRMTNLRANATADDAEESEAFDAVSPGDRNRIAVGINSIEEPGFSAWISSDGGLSWVRRTMPATMDRPGNSVDEAAEMCCDPTFAADEAGNIWYGGLSFSNDASDPGPNGASRIVVNRIGAGTTTFQPKNTGLPIRTGATAGQDKPMMTVDNSPSSPTRGRLYVVWNEPASGGGINLVLSKCDTILGGHTAADCDNSDNWSTPVSVTSSEGSYIYGDVAVDSTGRVYVTSWDFSATNAIMGDSCPGTAAAASCTSASDWGTPGTIAQLDQTGGNPVPFICPIMAQPGGRASPAPQLAIDLGTNRVYVVWSDLTGSGTTRCEELPTGDGEPQLPTHKTWDSYVASAAGALPGGASPSATSGTKLLSGATEDPNSDDWFPAVAVDQTASQPYVDFYSTREDSTRTTTNFYVRRVTPSGGGHTLGALTKVSSAPSDYSLTPCCTFDNDYGDYEGIDATGGTSFPVWTDNSAAAGGDGDAFVIQAPPVPASGGGNPATPSGSATSSQPATTPRDRTRPRLRLAAKRSQRLRSRRLVVAFRPNEAVTARFGAAITVRGAARTLRLRTIVRRVGAGRRVVVRFKLPRATRSRVARALRRRARVTATVTVRAVDRSGNATTTKLRIRLRL